MPTIQQARLGKQGEALACRELRRRGYAILARGYRTRAGEIDIIARDRDTLVFVEVKTRSSGHFGGPLAAVTADKRRRLVAMAQHYLARLGGGARPCRFDVVAIDTSGPDAPSVTLVVNAFSAAPGLP